MGTPDPSLMKIWLLTTEEGAGMLARGKVPEEVRLQAKSALSLCAENTGKDMRWKKAE